MKVRIDGLFLLVVVVLGLLGFGWFKSKQIAKEIAEVAGEIAEVAGKKLNPASTENVIYDDVVGGVGRYLTGDESWSLGGQLYDWFGDKP